MTENTPETESAVKDPIDASAAPQPEAVVQAPTERALPSSSVNCPHCNEVLRPHGDSLNALHCDGLACIGCCFIKQLKKLILRDGFPACPQA